MKQKNTGNKKTLLISAISVAAIIIAVAVAMIISALNQGKQIRLISIASTPDDTNYYVGEAANYEGLKILVTLVNGDTYTVGAKDCIITGFDSSKAAESQTVTVNYRDFLATFTVTIEDFPAPKPKLVAISWESFPTKNTYEKGERIDTSGGVLIRHYSDNTTEPISLIPDYVPGFNDVRYTPGTHTLTVKYKEGSSIVEEELTITVME